MSWTLRTFSCFVTVAAALCGLQTVGREGDSGLQLAWKDNYLTISGAKVPGGEVRTQYLEAYCRAGSTDRDWSQTTIGHSTELLAADPAGKWLRLRCKTAATGAVVDHTIRAGTDSVDFQVVAQQSDRSFVRGLVGVALHARRPLHRPEARRLSGQVLYRPRWSNRAFADTTVGDQGPIHARSSLAIADHRCRRR